MGRPKALLRDGDGVPYLDRAIGTLFEGGCTFVTVVLGASSDEAKEILRVHGWTECDDLDIEVNDDWRAGMGSSLRAGLAAVESSADAVVILLVDLPDVHDDAVRRLVAVAGPDMLARATYGGEPGHPVLIGRHHWAAVAESLSGDSGARRYLDANGAVAIACDDLATGRDLDRPEDLAGR